jgi:phosphoribosylformimino-5-aminoimidazole carboxamide ribotide isomerase
MQVIPVIDLKAGVVVRGIAGRREEYRPLLSSQLCSTAFPGDVARGFVRAFGFRTAYVADLDAISGAEPDWAAYEAIHAAGLSLWIDAGVGARERALQIAGVIQNARYGVDQIVLGLESLQDPSLLPDMLRLFGPARVIFSLDLHAGKPLTSIPQWLARSPREIAAEVIAAGVEAVLVLDLAAVGVKAGPAMHTLELARWLRREHPQCRLIGGGGARNAADLEQLGDAGFSAALVASALHDGRLTADEL